MFKRLAFVLLILITVPALLQMYLAVREYYLRYETWRSLSSGLVAEATHTYFDTRAVDVDEVSAICVYALDCSNGRARLAIVRDPSQYDFEALKQLIWARRFDGICHGQTANLGLQMARSQSDQGEWSDLAIWSFAGSRFIPRYGGHRGGGGAFSREPWERCTVQNATYLVRDGKIDGTEATE